MEFDNFFLIKKGQGHVEMITSFIIFIGFVFALFYFLNPLSNQDASQSQLDRIQVRILNNLTLDYRHIPLILDQIIIGNEENMPCFFVDDSLNIPVNMIVIDSAKELLQSSESNSKINIGFNSVYYSERYYNLYFSEAFNLYPLSATCSNISDFGAKAEFGILDNEKSILLENLDLFNQRYLSDYDTLKKELKIDKDFNFVVYDTNRTVIYNESLNTHGSLYARNMLSRNIPIKAIDKDATEHSLILNLRMW